VAREDPNTHHAQLTLPDGHARIAGDVVSNGPGGLGFYLGVPGAPKRVILPACTMYSVAQPWVRPRVCECCGVCCAASTPTPTLRVIDYPRCSPAAARLKPTPGHPWSTLATLIHPT
jgi:hypothetical protein